MEPIAQTLWRAEFTRRAELSQELQQRFAREVREAREKDDKDKEKAKEREDELFQLVQSVLATDADIEAFSVKLDHYDQATVQALMDNEADLNAIRQRLDEMLLQAHTLPDGRRVFKTEDGTQVFDENGVELEAEQISPDEIDDRKPTWEQFSAARDEQVRLEQERSDLIEYQGKLDAARERLDDPKLTKNELEALDKELGEAMPDRVRQTVGLEAKAPAARAENDQAPVAPSVDAQAPQRRVEMAPA